MLSRSIWLSMSQQTRQSIAIMLEIPRSGGMIVEDNRIVSDGYSDRDLMGISLHKLQEFLQLPDEDDFYFLLGLLVERIENPIGFQEMVDEVVADRHSDEAKDEEKFCDSCDSKGGRHKKECTKSL